MDLILLILGIAILGVLAWAITTYLPMDPIFKTIIYLVIAIALIVYVIRRFGNAVPNVMP